ncbi:gamma-glutamyl-gamma-aminobutyrate hydrolase family protein [Streptomyces sp. KMM 9044]|uniref:gamma-glutamyl-gamma-aminobutyrate hydrolase family protein n=1 Tax=Streptomyces sp. KMM 9044 TaxID=2744474 RepID=UPI002150A50E|nr:gamma-glutamyl-gamma-aminobutyrate hydrolase family protein [Streptomyces sp. KMM 9044]WAX76382.1 gamma-glutamyl-gamma-aminobutyrate hydrolase family protein [Streptomyces sp. KMM 9044]
MKSAPEGFDRQPVIGITARTVPVTLQGTDMVVSLALQSHVDFLAAAGCLPVLLPLRHGVERIVGDLDGLLVPGGPDVDPALYGQSRHPRTRGGSPEMDRAELALLGAALEAGLPLLAICRGMQLLNVQCGGTLHQHLPEITDNDTHRPQTAGFEFGRHVLDLRADSRIAGIFGDDTPKTACHHHQAVDQIGTGLTATAWAPDGVVEVVEAVGHPFAIGVQWEAGQTEDDRLHLALAKAAGRS